MIRQFLHEHWTFRAVNDLSHVPPTFKGRGKEISATVPGCVHTDLLAHELIPDPYVGRNELDLQWIGLTDWEYSTTFQVDQKTLDEARVDLVCDGLDTIARVELNGVVLGETANMHHPHRFSCKQHLKTGKNELRISFASALKYARAMEEKHGLRPHVDVHPFNYIRKMACNFGWDWGPALITAGIWQPIRLEAWSSTRIVAVRPLIKQADAHSAEVEVHVDLEHIDGLTTIDLVLAHGEQTRIAHREMVSTLREKDLLPNTSPDESSIASHEKPGESSETAAKAETGFHTAVATLKVKNPSLWWPRGHGHQPLYNLNVVLIDQAWEELDHWFGKVGIRTVHLNTDKDAIGSKFQFEVNGKPIFCKGANWIPDDCFLNRVTPARYRERIEQAVDSNMNMLRVWGGGIFETEAFYDICDELGIMVWQDFLFACAAYPEEEPFNRLVEDEVRYNVARLSRHASLVLWNGCNENIWAWFDWGWRLLLLPTGKSWGLGFYLELLPRICKEVDPSRPYWPGSPYSGTMDIHPLDDFHGNKHVWDVWNSVDYAAYRRYTPRFVSEFGWIGPPTYATLTSAIASEDRRVESPVMVHHNKARDGHAKITTRTEPHFVIPENLNDWMYVTQVNQARAVQAGVEWYRSRQPICMGTLYWQINDCWPVTSWACIDGQGRLKPLWYATRRFFADRLLTIQPEPDGTLVLHACNDSDQTWDSPVTVKRLGFDGEVRSMDTAIISAPARSRQRVAVLGPALSKPHHRSSELLVAEAASGGRGNHAGLSATGAVQGFGGISGIVTPAHPLRATWFFDVDKNLDYPMPRFEAKAWRDEVSQKLSITAKTLLRDLIVFADRLDPLAVIDDQMVTLLPGDSVTFTIRTQAVMSQEALTAPPVLQCANRFGRQI